MKTIRPTPPQTNNGNILPITPPHIIGMTITGLIIITLIIPTLIVIFLIRMNQIIKTKVPQKTREVLHIFHHITDIQITGRRLKIIHHVYHPRRHIGMDMGCIHITIHTRQSILRIRFILHTM